MVKYLLVAEKPSIAKAITAILSGGQFSTRDTPLGWIKNYDFSYALPQHQGYTDITVTAVAGHLMSSNFQDSHKSWRSCDPFDLFHATIDTFVNPVRSSPFVPSA